MSPQPAKARKPQGERRLRRYPRYRVEFPIQVVYYSDGERQTLDAHGRDLSTAGIGVLIAADLAMGEVMGLSFRLPGTQDLWNMRAVLRYRRGFHYGFEFLALSDAQASALTDYLPGLARSDRDSGASQREDGEI